MNPQTTLRAIKVIHTLAWAVFGSCILAIQVYAWAGNIQIAAILCGVVFLEVLILLFNNWSCPLTLLPLDTPKIGRTILTSICRCGWPATTKRFLEVSM